ncbi:MAG: radical SAM protein [Candidatus Alcyoniella australis]|nr:radical SAM protein [Candidatus Alcyoniella australis]
MAERFVLIFPRTTLLDRFKQAPTVPLPILAACRGLPPDVEPLLIDQRFEPDWRARLAAILERGDVIGVGLSVLTGHPIAPALEISRFVRQRAPGVSVVWGGKHPTLFPEQTARSPHVDVAVRREAEAVLPSLIEALRGQCDLADVPGVAFKRGNEVVRNPDAPYVDLNELPQVPYNLLDKAIYSPPGKSTTVFVETSRGCLKRCGYCYHSGAGTTKWRALEPERAVEQMLAVQREFPNLGLLEVVDDSFFHDLQRGLRIMELKIERGPQVPMQLQGVEVRNVALMNDEQLALLARAGVRRVDLGVESGSDRVQKLINKGVDLESARTQLVRLRRAGIIPWCNLILGFPDETAQERRSTVLFARDALRINPQTQISPIYSYTPYPGTKLFERARELGASYPEDIEGMAGFHWSNPQVPWIDERTRRELGRLYFYSIFIDGKIAHYHSNTLVRLAARLFRPVARYRLFRHRLGLPLAKWAFELAFGKDY